jgi:endonuclease G, mitochondrial
MPKRPLIALLWVAALSIGASAQAGFVPHQNCERIFAETGVPEVVGDTAQGGEYIDVCRRGYAAYLNTATRSPDWVAEEVTARGIKGRASRKDNFTEDRDAPPPASASLKDYAGSGFDRGHQAPAADFKNSQRLMDESFFMTNMAPQVGVCFNRGVWAQLEADVRDLAKTRKRLIVFTGPVYEGPIRTVGDLKKKKRGVDLAVPNAYYKVVYHPRTRRAMAFLMPNRKLCGQDPSEFLTSIQHVEELTGVDFFPALSRRDRNILERNQGNLWGW